MISIVIPTYDRPAALARCLAGVAAMAGARPDLEVIVVNDGGAPPPERSLQHLRDQLDLTIVEQPHGGPAVARNAGAARARSPFVAFLDDDCVPAADWLAALAARFAAAPHVAVGGRTLNGLPDNPFSTASQLLIDYLYKVHNAGAAPRFFASNNVAFPRHALLAIGGFDTGFPRAAGEDRDLCDRWRQRGHAMAFAPEAVVHHAHALGPASFWRQHFDYGRGACAYRRARVQRDGTRVAFEPPRFYANLLRAPFACGRGARALRLAALLALAQVANAAGYSWERTRVVARA
jgi:GT2 family glycosyltransferase